MKLELVATNKVLFFFFPQFFLTSGEVWTVSAKRLKLYIMG